MDNLIRQKEDIVVQKNPESFKKRYGVSDVEMINWINQHGSQHLKACIEQQYGCKRLYVIERAAVELPGFILDTSSMAKMEERVNPSESSLLETKRLQEEGYKSRVVFLKSPPFTPEESVSLKTWEPREAVVVWEYLGKYQLFKY